MAIELLIKMQGTERIHHSLMIHHLSFNVCKFQSIELIVRKLLLGSLFLTLQGRDRVPHPPWSSGTSVIFKPEVGELVNEWKGKRMHKGKKKRGKSAARWKGDYEIYNWCGVAWGWMEIVASSYNLWFKKTRYKRSPLANKSLFRFAFGLFLSFWL